MTATADFMPHRTTFRQSRTIPVRMYVPRRGAGLGRLLDISFDGAFLAAKAPEPDLDDRIQLVFMVPGPEAIEAVVVRRTERGIGVRFAQDSPETTALVERIIEQYVVRQRAPGRSTPSAEYTRA